MKMKEEKHSFEEKMEKLETLVKSLEAGDVPLDQAIANYTEAVTLAKECDDALKQAEKALTEIVHDDGTITEFKEIEI